MAEREIWVADCETDPFKKGRIPKPFLWGAYNGSEYHEFETVEQFMDFITEKECIVYAHNGGKFDWFFVLDYLEQFEPLTVIAGRLAKFVIGNAEFRDSYNILPVSLATYQKDKVDYEIFEKEKRDLPENKKIISAYLRADCIYLYQLVNAFINEYGLNLTVAGTAMKMWQKIADVKAPKTNQSFYETIAPFYYGGRVECFHTGLIQKPFKVIDINSAYPWAMEHLHPFGDTYDISDELPKTRPFIERSFITLSCRSKGAFPFREKSGLRFPSDDCVRTYFVTGWEYLAAVDTDTISDIEIIEVITFSDSINFSDYIAHFYALKEDAQNRMTEIETLLPDLFETDERYKKAKADRIFAKLFLNALYGKFGANPENYSEYTVVKPRYIDAAECEGYGYCADFGPWALCSRELTEEKARYYNAAVAASITGFVRAMLWRAINQCEGVLYCDTDSIACTDTGTLELDKVKLGAWDVEALCDSGGIAGKKLYAFHTVKGKWKTASKGVRLSPEDILKVASGEEVTYEPENPSFSIKRGIQFINRKISKIE